ncbi:MAG: chemotaxis protein CheC [Acidobacteria bacterium]|nr:chemotaxis protein CheC [Acidobacteriota bacterium]
MFGNEELDALRELINIGVGRAAGALNDMVGRNVRLNVPSVSVVPDDQIVRFLCADEEERLACVRLRFEGALRGVADLIFPSQSGSKLVALLSGEEPCTPGMDSLRAGTLTEVGNILLNGLLGSITNVVDEHLTYGLPMYLEETAGNIERSLRSIPDAAVLMAQAQFLVGKSEFEVAGERIDGEITLLLGLDSLEHLLERVHLLGEEDDF